MKKRIYMIVFLSSVVGIQPVWYNPFSWSGASTATAGSGPASGNQTPTIVVPHGVFYALSERVKKLEDRSSIMGSGFSDTLGNIAGCINNFCVTSVDSVFSYVSDHKGVIIATAVAGVTAYYLKNFFCLHHALNKTDNWSLWKADEVNKVTSIADGALLEQALLQEIQLRYIDVHNITHFMGPVTRFMQAIEKELASLKKFNQIYGILNSIVCGTPASRCISRYNIPNIQERIRRLMTLKGICIRWVINAKLSTSCVDMRH